MRKWLFFLLSLLVVFSGADAEPRGQKAEQVSLEELSSHYDVFLLDAYGVFWGSSEVGVLLGAAEAMKYLVDQGKHVGIISNSTQLASKEKEKLLRHGLQEGVHYHFFLTSGEVARELFKQAALPFPTPRYTYCLFGSIHPRFGSHTQLFEGTNYRETKSLEEADFIYIAIPHLDGVDQEDPEVFREAVQAIVPQVPILCVNPDRFAMEGLPPRPVVRQGSIAQLFAENDAVVHLIGKPSQIIFEAALQKLPIEVLKERILMIGDTPETDIRGARGMGIDAVLVLKTGVIARDWEEKGAALIEQLPSSDRPKFLLERLQLQKS